MDDVIVRLGISWTWQRLQRAWAVVAVWAAVIVILAGPGWLGMTNAFLAGFAVAMAHFCGYALTQRRIFAGMSEAMDTVVEANNHMVEINNQLAFALAEVRGTPPIAPDAKPTMQ